MRYITIIDETGCGNLEAIKEVVELGYPSLKVSIIIDEGDE